MHRVALSVVPEGAWPVDDGSGTPTDLTSFRVFAKIEIAGWVWTVDALLDTGAPVTILSKAAWLRTQNAGAIRWLQYDPARFPDPGRLPTTPILGANYPYRLGVLPVVLREPPPSPNRLGPVDVTAYFLEDYPPTAAVPALKYPIILGLGQGVMADRFLVCGPGGRTGAAEAWVQDGRP